MVRQYDIYWVNLDPTTGSKIKKTRPCLIISPDISNKLMRTVLVAPITSTLRSLPMRVRCSLDGRPGDICLDHIRSIDKSRLNNKIGTLKKGVITEFKKTLKEFLID